jgi:hypothetical protein
MLTFGSKLNRSYTLYLPMLNSHVGISVFFHKGNTSIGFKPDHTLQDMSKNDNINITTYKDLKKSVFASSFLEIADFTSDTLNIKNQFSNIREPFREKIQYLANESIKLSKHELEDGKRPLQNLIYLYVFSFTDYDNEFIYILAERQHIDTVLGKKFVRTSAIQLTTQNCMNDMLKIAEYHRGESLQSFEKLSRETSEEQIQALFPEKDARIKKL